MAGKTLTPRGGQSTSRSVSAPLSWRSQAACRRVPTAVFFPAGNFARMEEKQAKSVCAMCPVRVPCLTFALEHVEPFGVWGGLSTEERRALAGQNRGTERGSGPMADG
jgi:WhiB family redox-sensing transcriptional regulator